MAIRLKTAPPRALAGVRRPGLPVLAVAGSALLLGILLAISASRVRGYIWLIDEFLWHKAATAVGNGDGLLRPELHGQPFGQPNNLFPLVAGPFYGLFGNVTGFKAAHVLNGLFFGSVVIPVYLLGRRLRLDWRWALAAGVLSVVVPWTVATLVVMTESIAYVTFCWALLAVVVAVDDPRPRNDLLAVVAIAVVTFARTQFVLMAGILVLAILLREVAAREPWRVRWQRLRGHWLGAALIGAAVAAYLLLRAVGIDVAGNYSGLLSAERFPPGLPAQSVLHLGYPIVASGILPFVLWVAWLIRTGSDPRGHSTDQAMAIVGLLTVAAMVYTATFFAATLTPFEVQERYSFYVIPVFMLGMVALVADRSRLAPRISVLVGAAVVAALCTGISFDGAETQGPFDAIAAAGRGTQPIVGDRLNQLTGMRRNEAMALVVFLVAAVAIAALGARRRGWGVALVAAVGLFCAWETWYLLNQTRTDINVNAYRQIVQPDAVPQDWVDRAAGRDGSVRIVASRLGSPDDTAQWTWAEFWNASVRDNIAVVDRREKVEPGFSGGRIDVQTGRIALPEPTAYVLQPRTPATLRVRGRAVGAIPSGITLSEVPRPDAWQADYLMQGGTVDGGADRTRPLTLYVYPPEGQPARRTPVTLGMFVSTDGPPEGLPFRVVNGAGERRRGSLQPGEGEEVRLAATPEPGGRRSVLRIEPEAFRTMPDGAIISLQAGVVAVG